MFPFRSLRSSLRASLLVLVAIAIFACGNAPPAVTPIALDTPTSDGGVARSVPAIESRAANAADEKAAVPVFADDPVRGSANALVTVVVFSDFQCPFCKRAEDTLTQVLDTYAGKVRIVWKHEPLPFHDKARPAARMAHALFYKHGNEAFWDFHDQLFRNQTDIGGEALERYAHNVVKGPLDLSQQWKKAEEKVDRDHELAKKLGINGTPGFFINGVLLSGAQPFERFKVAIDEQLKKAAELEKSGTPRDRIYAAATDANFKQPSAHGDDDEVEDAATVAARAKEAARVFRVPVGKSPVRGLADALVTLVVFSDFQCPFCGRVEPTFTQIKQTYGDKVRIVWKNEPLPFHNRAVPAAKFAMEVRAQKGDAAFWTAHDRLFEEQKNLEDPTFETIAKELKVDVKQALAATTSDKFKKALDEDATLADDVKASGTPHSFINGRRLVGAQPFEKFKALIDEELTKAEAMVKSGTPKAKVYATIMAAVKADPGVQVTAGPKAPIRGPANAKVTIHEFADYECPFCGKVEPVLEEVMKHYAGKVKIVWHDDPLPFHKKAPLAAMAAREAYAQKGNDGYWKMHDKLFANQSTPDGLERQALDSYAKEIGLDMTKFGAALDKNAHKSLVDDDIAAAKAADVTGTPSFVINGRSLSGAQPIEKFKAAIDRALAP